MKMFNIQGDLVNVDVRQSSYPISLGGKSKLQLELGKKLQELYPYDVILEEFPVPGSRMRVDFFVPGKRLLYEADGAQHDNFIPFFHGDKATSNKYAGQVIRDSSKETWAEMNGFSLNRIKTVKEIEELVKNG
jgi:hypothetical protein